MPELFTIDEFSALPSFDDRYTETREQLHRIVQIAGAVGNTLVPEQEDDTHTTLWWSDDLTALLTRETPDGFHLGLRFDGPSLILTDRNRSVVDEFRLEGSLLKDAWAWAAEGIAQFRGGALPELEARDYGLDRHEIEEGAAITIDPDATAGAGRWFGTANALLSRFTEGRDGASAVRCWPHHFDIAVLDLLTPSEGPEESPSVNIGLSPGDDGYATPYFYVVPWPTPDNPDPAPLDDGAWSTDGWVGAMLGEVELTDGRSAAEQRTALLRFCSSAFTTARRMIEQ